MKKKIGAVLLVIIMALALGLPAPPARAASIIYVDTDATEANDGTSWSDAYTDLQSALNNATSGDEIWVAEGIYKPTGGTNRYATFNLVSHVALYGGFAGDETTRDERDWVVNQTILSGNIGQLNDASDNSYHVVTSEDTKGAILDGFTVTGGNANAYAAPDNSGGGIYNNSELTVNNCIISYNTAIFRGGGLFNSGGTVTLNSVIISQNTSTGSTGGWATGGGGIEVSGVGSPLTTITLINCIVNGNTATASGKDIYGNLRKGDGGAIRVGGGGTAVNITSSTIVNNQAEDEGGGIRAAGTSTIKNSILWGNTAPSGAQFTGTPTITYSLVQGGYPAGKKVISDDPLFVDADGDDNTIGTLDDNLHLQASSPAIDAGKNSDVPTGVTVDLDGNPRIVNRTVDMGAFEYLTPIQADTLDLIEQVGDLVDGEVLNPGQGNALTVKLEAAIDQMNRNAKTAINQLEAFINQVEDFIEEGILTEADGQSLIDAANEIIGAL